MRFMLSVVWAIIAGSAVSAAETPAVLKPYAVAWEVRFERSPLLDSESREQVLAGLQQTAVRTLGEHWEPTIVGTETAGDGFAALDRWTSSALTEAQQKADKLFITAVSVQGAGFEIQSLEWDPFVQSLSRSTRRFVPDFSELPVSISTQVHELYRPQAEIVKTRSGDLKMEARAGSLLPPDPAWTPMPDTGLWEPFYRVLAADMTLQRIQPIPWTYLSAREIAGPRAAIEVVSGLRAPLNARRRRVQPVALRVQTPRDATRLTLRVAGASPRLLAGLEVRLLADPKKPPSAVLVSDRLGVVQIPRGDKPEPVWLHIYSGLELLARIPCIPGLRPAEVLELPDDSLRLKVEGEVTLLQADLVDTVARRATLMATARNRAKTGDIPGVLDYLAQLTELKRAEVFTAQLAAIRLSGTQSAKSRKNRVAESRIKKLCDETEELITAYLNPDRLRQLDEEALELREAAKVSKEALQQLSERKNAPAKPPAKPTPKAPAAKPAPAPGPTPMPPPAGAQPGPGPAGPPMPMQPTPPKAAPGF